LLLRLGFASRLSFLAVVYSVVVNLFDGGIVVGVDTVTIWRFVSVIVLLLVSVELLSPCRASAIVYVCSGAIALQVVSCVLVRSGVNRVLSMAMADSAAPWR
jgi:hypothetical protein